MGCAPLLLLASARAAYFSPPGGIETRNYTVHNASFMELQPWDSEGLDTYITDVVQPGGWHDYYVDATRIDDDSTNIQFEVVAETYSPAGIGIYVFDQSSHSPDSEGLLFSKPPPDGPTTTIVHPEGKAVIPNTAAAIDTDVLSRIGNFTHRTYFGYVGCCYVSAGARFFLSIYGFHTEPVRFYARALRIQTQMILPPVVTSSTVIDAPDSSNYTKDTVNETLHNSNCSNMSMPQGWCHDDEAAQKGSVCDGKYMHHFFDLDVVPPSGGLEIRVDKTSGELEGFYVRYERCAGPEGHAIHTNSSTGNLAHLNLFGHGLSSAFMKIPNPLHNLLPGRYYISVRGSVEFCGDYTVHVKRDNITEFNLAPRAL